MSHGDLPPSVDKWYVDRIIWLLMAVSAVAVLAELAIPIIDHHPKHGDFWFDQSFGFHAWFGFISCVTLVLAARELRKWVMRPEDYYDE